MRRFACALVALLLTGCSSLPRRSGGGTQHLFRVEAREGEREVDLRLVLRESGPDRFHLAAADLLGRTLWSLSVDGGRFVWADHRERRVCRGTASRRIVLPLLGLDLPPEAAPRILLGDLPVPIPEAPPDTAGRVRSFADNHGQLWRAIWGADGALAEWTMTGREGAPLASWRAEAAGAEMEIVPLELHLRWRLRSAEPLPPGWAPAAPPAAFEEGRCDRRAIP